MFALHFTSTFHNIFSRDFQFNSTETTNSTAKKTKASYAEVVKNTPQLGQRSYRCFLLHLHFIIVHLHFTHLHFSSQVETVTKNKKKKKRTSAGLCLCLWSLGLVFVLVYVLVFVCLSAFECVFVPLTLSLYFPIFSL